MSSTGNRNTFRWTPEQIREAQRLVDSVPHPGTRGVAAGYRKAAEALGTTEEAIRHLIKRAGTPQEAIAPDCNTPKPAPTYAERLAERSERAQIRTLERDKHALQEAIRTMGELTSSPLPAIKRYERTSGLREGTAFGLLSDVHSEEKVVLGETPVPNEYNLEIADRSIARFFTGFRHLVDFQRERFRITDVVTWLGGDLMTGHIHEENVETTSLAPVETLLWLKPRLLAGIDHLLEDSKTERLHVVCSYGNHGRNTRKLYRARGAAHSYEWLLYQFLAEHYRENPRVRFLATPSAHQYVQVYDWDVHFHHGDETNYQGGVGGVTIPVNKAVGQWDIARKCHFHNFGHWHQYIDTGRIALNGSVIGYNAFAMSIKATPEPPQQAFYVLDSKRGKTAKFPIWVRE